MADLLFEIGTEEIPAGFLPPALAQIKSLAQALLQEQRIPYGEITSLGTPRRLALLVTDLSPQQADSVEEIKGPPARIAYNDQGEFTKAALGFIKKQQVQPEDIYQSEVKGQNYLFARKRTQGQATSALLPALLKTIVTRLNFPKPMRWGSLEMRFARPIRWLVALLDETIIPIEIAQIKSNKITRGHRFLGSDSIVIASPQHYLQALEDNYVLVDPDARRNLIIEQVKDLERQHNIRVEMEEDLLEEIVCLVEYPTAFLGNFQAKYLAMPEEVIITPMKEHQRYFPVRHLDGSLANCFVGVRNGNDEHIASVQHGNEKVLTARLADAEFFYQEDQKKPLAAYIEQLKPVVFQEKLGTMYQKMQRIVEITTQVCKGLHYSTQETEQAKRAAMLCKADLVTHMVYEFPELQGVMGEKYALLSAEPETVAKAIYEHYLPRFAEDQLPQTAIGIAVSIADKIDTIAGCFAVGLKVSGSQDPYALRRKAAGICSILLNHRLPLSLTELIQFALNALRDIETLDNIEHDIYEFFGLRIRHILLNEYSFSYDVVDAVMASGYANVYDTLLRAKALTEMKNSPSFDRLITSFKRANNLAQKGDTVQIYPDLLQENAEQALYQSYLRVSAAMQKSQTYSEKLLAFGQLEEPINTFFADVMVMAPEEALRNNRLALLQQIVNLTVTIADLTCIVSE